MKKMNSIFWGIIVILVGIIFFLNSLGITNLNIFFDGWWTLFIIVPSIYGIIKGEFISSILGISIGVLLFLATWGIIDWSMVGKLFIGILLVVIGLSIIFRPKPRVEINKKGLPEFIGVFSGNEQKITDKFLGANVVVVFGEVNLDLREAKIDSDIVIDCVSVFGGIDIILPDGKTVKTSGVPIFGGIGNEYKSKEGHLITINYVCVFGGIEIK